ncbi:SDR family oxidoreductase [Nostoc sp. NMS4]|uniref:SDR family NAD(P)-dependent oxidoreductase n=1 Tax=Nostoc sp. NMS4 TaxID=2815390 RepID=UPI0025D5E427|nr:SDR family oxidoreductase [Nostoc sp. NMS4]MBN3926170.1 SDR family oxidoreductase [Nostoc sp. NMS4]
MSQEKYLKNRVALVTGGASGMGRAMALAFAEAGADVVVGSLLTGGGSKAPGELVYLPGAAELDRIKKEIEARGVRAIATNLDVCSMDSVQAFYDATIKAFGKVDILANAAGISAEQTICGHPDQLWHKVVDVNVNGVYRTIKLCLPGMIERKWGRIINIASTAASVGAPASAAYCASKAAVVGLTRCVALEGAPHGVSCNAISPGWVQTNFGKIWMVHIAETAEGQNKDEYIQEIKQINPQKRMIQPEEIGAIAAFLCREEAFGITMQDITISAGSLW